MSTAEDLKKEIETVWINPDMTEVTPMTEMAGQKFLKIKAAQNRLLRFMPYIASAFPETAAKKGLIESELIPADMLPGTSMFRTCGDTVSVPSYSAASPDFAGHIFIKDDARLPIAGSVKARGGIHEVLAHTEKLMQHAHMLMPGDDYSVIDSDKFRDFFGKYTIQAGSTGNLGLSIGIMASRLGFKVIIHMSADAKEWKKELLRSQGVCVKEYASDYTAAVAEGRRLSAEDPDSYFIDDENSEDLFFGYATAALRLKIQLLRAGINVDGSHPLFVWLPCGVGGAPGGITFGLKQLFGSDVHCFFAEPTGAPCFTLGMSSGKGNNISVNDIGLSGHTEADGLAVARPSGFVCHMMKPLVSGSYTVSDRRLKEYMRTVYDSLGLFLEPSAYAGFHGPAALPYSGVFAEYLRAHGLLDISGDGSCPAARATHIIWATGGGLVPDPVRAELLGISQQHISVPPRFITD